MTGEVNTAGAGGALHEKRSLTSVAVFPAVAANPVSRAQPVGEEGACTRGGRRPLRDTEREVLERWCFC